MPIIQRTKECTLVAICNLNGLSQQAYEALSDKVHAKHGPYTAGRYKKKFNRIAYGISLCKKAGLRVPEGFKASAFHVFPAGRAPQLGGSGILTMSFFKKRARKAFAHHAVAYRDGTVIESNGRIYADWGAFVAACSAHRVRIDRMFPEKN